MQANKRPKSSLTREGCKSPQRRTQHLPTVCKGDAKQQESRRNTRLVPNSFAPKADQTESVSGPKCRLRTTSEEALKDIARTGTTDIKEKGDR